MRIPGELPGEALRAGEFSERDASTNPTGCYNVLQMDFLVENLFVEADREPILPNMA